MAMERWDPFSEMVNRMFGERFGRPWQMTTQMGYSLPMDVCEMDDEFLIRASAPGMRPEDLDISVKEDTLTIRGEIHTAGVDATGVDRSAADEAGPGAAAGKPGSGAGQERPLLAPGDPLRPVHPHRHPSLGSQWQQRASRVRQRDAHPSSAEGRGGQAPAHRGPRGRTAPADHSGSGLDPTVTRTRPCFTVRCGGRVHLEPERYLQEVPLRRATTHHPRRRTAASVHDATSRWAGRPARSRRRRREEARNRRRRLSPGSAPGAGGGARSAGFRILPNSRDEHRSKNPYFFMVLFFSPQQHFVSRTLSG